MSAQDWAGLILTCLTIFGILVGGVKFLVKHYLSELKPNSGTSLKDSVNRLEIRVDEIMTILMTQNVKPKRKAKPSCDCNKTE